MIASDYKQTLSSQYRLIFLYILMLKNGVMILGEITFLTVLIKKFPFVS